MAMTDLQIIRQRLALHALASTERLASRESLSAQARAALETLTTEGSWADIRYDDRERAHWRPAQHLQRVLWILRAAHLEPDEDARERLFVGAQRGLTFWLARKPESDNWWHNDIGAPNVIGQILLLLGERLAEAERAQALAILERVKIGMTGQNRAWVATIAFVRGALCGDEALMRLALDEVLALVRVTDAPEGIQPDWSFHQHGPQLYQGNYGAHFPETVAPYVTWLRGTRYEMPADKVEVLCRLLLEGTQWMTWGSLMDYHVVGRFISSPLRSRWESRVLVRPCEHLAEVAPAHSEALLAFRDRLLEESPPGQEAPVGNRCFWRSDFMVQRRDDLYTSIRMSSTRTAPSEACNREGLRNYHLGDGVSLFLRDGQEYVDIFPVWDWRRLPGVTCRWSEEPLPVLSTGRDRGTGIFVGGASDGRDGWRRWSSTAPECRGARPGSVGRMCWSAWAQESVPPAATQSIPR